MQMLSTAAKLDWGGWLKGIIGAVVSGGAGAVGGSMGSIVADPTHFNLGAGGLHSVLIVAGTAFVVSGIISLAKYLQTNPVPGAAS